MNLPFPGITRHSYLIRYFFSSLLLCLPFFSSGQNNSQHILASQSGFDQSDDLSISWTIGEPFTETISTSDTHLTQGFQQPNIEISNIHQSNESFAFALYPNPTPGILKLKSLSGVDGYLVEIIDMTGRILYRSMQEQIETELDLTGYASGQYFIRISNSDDLKYTVFSVSRLQ